jgi:hypothetical protein
MGELSVPKAGQIVCDLVPMKVFYEDLARQNIVARLFQRQLGFRRRHTWVSVIAAAS